MKCKEELSWVRYRPPKGGSIFPFRIYVTVVKSHQLVSETFYRARGTAAWRLGSVVEVLPVSREVSRDGGWSSSGHGRDDRDKLGVLAGHDVERKVGSVVQAYRAAL